VSDLIPIRNEILQRTGKLVNGWQDMAEDGKGNTYTITSFGTVIVKIDRHGTPSVWYEPQALKTRSLPVG
jgi:hypothetical protein